MTETPEPISLERDGRSFLVEYDSNPLAPGWLLRERYRDGWPIMAGPCLNADTAVAFIDALLAAGPLCDYADEHGYQSCWV
jgi:hypothetical protein